MRATSKNGKTPLRPWTKTGKGTTPPDGCPAVVDCPACGAPVRYRYRAFHCACGYHWRVSRQKGPEENKSLWLPEWPEGPDKCRVAPDSEARCPSEDEIHRRAKVIKAFARFFATTCRPTWTRHDSDAHAIQQGLLAGVRRYRCRLE